MAGHFHSKELHVPDTTAPVWLPHFSSDMPAGELALRDGAAHQLVALARETQLLIALTVNDDDMLEVTILPHAVPAPSTFPAPGRITAQQHLEYWLTMLNAGETSGPARRQAEREVAYWRRMVRREHRGLLK